MLGQAAAVRARLPRLLMRRRGQYQAGQQGASSAHDEPAAAGVRHAECGRRRTVREQICRPHARADDVADRHHIADDRSRLGELRVTRRPGLLYYVYYY